MAIISMVVPTYFVDTTGQLILDVITGDPIIIGVQSYDVDTDYEKTASGPLREIRSFTVVESPTRSQWRLRINRDQHIGYFPTRAAALGALWGHFYRSGSTGPDGITEAVAQQLVFQRSTIGGAPDSTGPPPGSTFNIVAPPTSAPPEAFAFVSVISEDYSVVNLSQTGMDQIATGGNIDGIEGVVIDGLGFSINVGTGTVKPSITTSSVFTFSIGGNDYATLPTFVDSNTIRFADPTLGSVLSTAGTNLIDTLTIT